MELADNSLDKKISEKRKNFDYFSQNEIFDISFTIIEFLKQLHHDEKVKIAYRDMKPSNLLIKNN